MGGSNDFTNLVDLTAREHFICHMLLVEIYPGNEKLVYAAWRMVNYNGKTKQRYIPSGRIYEFIRQSHASVMSRNFKGRKMSKECIAKRKQTRKIFAHTEATKEKISKANSGKVRNEDFKQNLSRMYKGMSARNKGVPMKDEVKQRISETMKRIRAMKKQLKTNTDK
jgi:hypothetical protein